jgi:hypothetical protein
MNTSLKAFNRPLFFIVLLNLIPQFELRPVWVTAMAIVLVGYRVSLEVAGHPMPPRPLKWLVQVVMMVAIWVGFHTFVGAESGGALLILLLGVKIFELSRERDYFITCILCLLILMSNLLLDQGLLMTVFLVIDVLVLMAFLMALQARQWTWKSWRPTLKPVLFLLLKTLPLMALIFILFPRFSTGFGSVNNSVGTTGVSDRLHPGALAKLIPSDDLIFRATFVGDMPLQSQLYWKGAVLDRSNGLNWSRSSYRDRHPLPAAALDHPDIEIFLEPGSERFLFVLDNMHLLSFPAQGNPLVARSGNTFELIEPLQSRERYLLQKGVQGRGEDRPPDSFLGADEKPSDQLREFLKPFKGLGANQIVHDLLNHFHEGGFGYSLSPPPVRDMDEFLFKSKVGFCEHFAGTFATLLRLLQVPSRVVVGFQGGTPSLLDNYISVRGHDAHAWVEYYDSVDQRWRRVDPTAEVAPLRLSEDSASYFQSDSKIPNWGGLRVGFLRFRAFLDEVEASWVGFLLHFDLSRQKELLRALGMEEALFRALPVFLALAVVFLLTVLYFVQSRRTDPLSADEKIYRQLQRQLAQRWRIRKLPSEGPLALMAKVEARDPRLAVVVEPILEALIETRYRSQPLTHKAIELMRLRLKLLRKMDDSG